MPDKLAPVAVWRTRPIFITSTFRDMHAERDWLRNHVFPELEERLRARHCHLEIIDLRWGVETVSLDQEQAKEILVLKVCLNVLLLSHAAGISVSSTSVDSLLFRWVGELAAALGMAVPVEENAGPDELEASFARLLFQAANARRVVVLLDALNRFDPTIRAKYLSWLPRICPPNARPLAASIPDTASRALEIRPKQNNCIGICMPESRQSSGARRRTGICGVAVPRRCPTSPASRRLASAHPALAPECELIFARALRD